MAVTLKKMSGVILEDTGIGANSLDTTGMCTLVKRSGNIVSQATGPTDRIVGASISETAFASDNQTVAQLPLNYRPKEVWAEYEMAVSGGTITVADEGKFFNLASADTVDGATETTTIGTTQLVMTKFISSTKCWFRIVNL